VGQIVKILREKVPSSGGGGPTNIPAIAGEVVEDGSILYISANDIVKKADRAVFTKSFVVGIAFGSAVPAGPVLVQQDGLALVRMIGGLTLNPNDLVFLDAAGRGTNVAPDSPDAETVVGQVLDASGYNPIGLDPKAMVALDIDEPIFIM